MAPKNIGCLLYSKINRIMSKLIPLQDNIIVKPIKEENTTKSGIVLPDSNKEKPGKWEVIAIGEWLILEDGKRAPMDLKVWDVVHFTKYSPDEVEVDNNWEKLKYLILKQSSVLAKEE